MTVPPDQGRGSNEPPWGQAASPHAGPPGSEPPLDFDPYRFGRPEHPIAPEYAPPGYRQPPPSGGPQYPYTPSPPPPPPGYPAYEAQRTGNTKAVIALVLGVLAIVFCWLSIFDLVLIVPAIVLGILARNDAGRYPERGGRGVATGGLVCGLIAALLAVVATVYIYQRVKPCLDNYSTSSKAYENCVTDRIIGN